MHYYSWHLADYLTATAHLSPIEDLAYRRLLDRYYASEAPLPVDVDELARLVRLRGHEAEIRQVLAEFWVRTDAGWTQGRAEQQLLELRERADAQRARAGVRWQRARQAPEPTSEHSHAACGGSAAAVPDACGGTATQYPIPNTQHPTGGDQKARKRARAVEVDRPDDVSEQTWSDWQVVRRARRAPITATALDQVRREATLAGWSIEDALRECAARGWQSCRAEWLQRSQERPGATIGARAGPRHPPRTEANLAVMQRWLERHEGEG